GQTCLSTSTSSNERSFILHLASTPCFIICCVHFFRSRPYIFKLLKKKSSVIFLTELFPFIICPFHTYFHSKGTARLLVGVIKISLTFSRLNVRTSIQKHRL